MGPPKDLDGAPFVGPAGSPLRASWDLIGAFLLAFLASRYGPFQAPLGPLVFLSSLVYFINRHFSVVLASLGPPQTE
jgi:hypothetical protein